MKIVVVQKVDVKKKKVVVIGNRNFVVVEEVVAVDIVIDKIAEMIVVFVEEQHIFYLELIGIHQLEVLKSLKVSKFYKCSLNYRDSLK